MVFSCKKIYIHINFYAKILCKFYTFTFLCKFHLLIPPTSTLYLNSLQTQRPTEKLFRLFLARLSTINSTWSMSYSLRLWTINYPSGRAALPDNVVRLKLLVFWSPNEVDGIASAYISNQNGREAPGRKEFCVFFGDERFQ